MLKAAFLLVALGRALSQEAPLVPELLAIGEVFRQVGFGREYLAQKRYDAAYAHFHSALEANPDDEGAIDGLVAVEEGLMLEATGLPDLPTELVETDLAEAMAKGHAHEEANGEAEQHYREALGRVTQAWVRPEDYELAMPLFRAAARLHPSTAHLNDMAVTYLRTGT